MSQEWHNTLGSGHTQSQFEELHTLSKTDTFREVWHHLMSLVLIENKVRCSGLLR